MKTTDAKSDAIILGTAYRTINPPEGAWLVGYPHPEKRPNTGVALDLCARAVVFGSPETQAPVAAIVVMDSLAVTAKLTARIRQAAAERIPGLAPESIMVAATHTHSAPASAAMQSGTGDWDVAAAPDYVDQLVEKAADALAEAWEGRGTGHLRVGRTEICLGHNRRVVDAQGRATNVWHDWEERHTGYVNPNVRFLVFEDATTRTPKAIISLYGCHPVTLGPGNPKASADYPGYFVRAIESALPGCFAMHLTGAAGDTNPRKGGLSDDPEHAKGYGDALARAVLDELSHTRPVSAEPIRVHSEPLVLPLGPDAGRNYSCRANDSVDGKTLTSEVQVLRIGDIALISTPGELFSLTGVAIENNSPFAATFVVGYANDSLGYLVTTAVLQAGAYEAQNAISHEFEPRLTDTARAALDEAFA